MITYITNTLAIGTAEDALQVSRNHFDATLNVAIDLDFQEEFKWRHKIGLLDGPGNDPLTFMAAVIMLHSLLRQGKRVLLHCHAGTSRSVMVGATYTAAMGITTFDDALQKIMLQRKIDSYRPSLYDLAQSVLPKLQEIITK